MRVVCDAYSKLVPDASDQLRTSTGELVPPEIVSIGSDFVDLQRARFQADYDTAAAITQAEAQNNVRLAESAAANWQEVQDDPAAATFLDELLCRVSRSAERGAGGLSGNAERPPAA